MIQYYYEIEKHTHERETKMTEKFQSAEQMINDEIRELHAARYIAGYNANDDEKIAIDAQLDKLIEELARILK